ncbi:hypothetical protein [Flavobacterium sp.]|uniref:hypothetical protein n=1 Tax=Flavobacterium sp. TaxID=239 RepID=UPI00260B2A2D|nr:hypothetical protein [Flavobacterium sp.]
MLIEKFKLKGWKKKETGILIFENENWILAKHIPIDYTVDGYKIYNKKFIKKRKAISNDDKLVIVLKLKKLNLEKPKDLKLDSAFDILKWSENKYGLFEFQDDSENELFYGKMNKIIGNEFIIDMILSNGKIETEYDFNFLIYEIRVITFETDYFESIRLLMNYEAN